MFSEKQWILIRGSIAAKKLIDGIKEAILEGNFEKVLGSDPPIALKQHFALKAKFGMKNITITTYRKNLMLGFYMLETEENFLNKEESDNVRRLCLLNKLLINKMEEQTALKLVLEEYPQK